jgi:hypothetical protein
LPAPPLETKGVIIQWLWHSKRKEIPEVNLLAPRKRGVSEGEDALDVFEHWVHEAVGLRERGPGLLDFGLARPVYESEAMADLAWWAEAGMVVSLYIGVTGSTVRQRDAIRAWELSRRHSGTPVALLRLLELSEGDESVVAWRWKGFFEPRGHAGGHQRR